MNKRQAYIEMKLTAGWQVIEEEIKTQLEAFNYKCLNGFKNHDEYEYNRGYTQALNNLLVDINHELSKSPEESTQ